MSLEEEGIILKSWKTIIVMIIDLFMVNMAYLFSINITQTGTFTEISKIYTHDVIALSLIYLVCFYLFKMYESLWHLTGTDDLVYPIDNIPAKIFPPTPNKNSSVPVKCHKLSYILNK